jgi:hypothetical protein
MLASWAWQTPRTAPTRLICVNRSTGNQERARARDRAARAIEHGLARVARRGTAAFAGKTRALAWLRAGAHELVAGFDALQKKK